MQDGNIASPDLLQVSIELYKHADSAYFSQWEMLGAISIAYLGFIFSDLFNKLRLIGHYLIMIMLGYYFYLNSLWILVSVDVLRANSKIINLLTDRYIANELFLLDWEIITIHLILGGILICIGFVRIHFANKVAFTPTSKQDTDISTP
ncbi:hypothetical protein [Glaciecola sp. 1036]|uniref:hypothetical protein n=1 Tax=Alteromonadaceae TaxID=72275 RepID=UPI003D071A1B